MSIFQIILIGLCPIYLIVVCIGIVNTRREITDPRWRRRAVLWEIFVLLLLPIGYFSYQHYQKQKRLDAKYALMTAARNRFDQLCKGAGEKIYRTVDDVDGVFLMKIDLDPSTNDSQYSINAKSPYESLGSFHPSGGIFKTDHEVVYLSYDTYIKSFLIDGAFTIYGHWVEEDGKGKRRPAFRYVEAIDPGDGKRYRYTGSWQKVDKILSFEWKQIAYEIGYIPRELLEPANHSDGARYNFVLTREPAGDPPPRYGVTYDDLETPEERKMWIAGSALKVVDLQTGELLGQRIGYLHDRGGGSTAGGRQPWAHAIRGIGWSCPAWFVAEHSSDNFVLKILHPKLGE